MRDLLQHAILFLKVMLAYLIPDKPEWVETSVAADDYQSRLAFKRQVFVSEVFFSSAFCVQHILPICGCW